MSGSTKPPSRFITVNASLGLVKTIVNVSMNALTNPRSWRCSHGSPLRVGGVSDVDPAGAGVIVDAAGGGGADGDGAPLGISAANSENCESDSQLAIPSRQPRSVPAKRPERSPARTSSSENVPRLVPPRLTWMVAIMSAF